MSRPSLIFLRSPIPYPGGYIWRAAVNYITDGDTLWVERDSGGRDTQLMELRLTGMAFKGFNAAERFTAQGKLITARVQELIPPGSIVRIETARDTEKYGRWLSPVLIPIVSGAMNQQYWDGPLPISPITSTGADLMDGGIPYLSLAEHLNRNFPGAVWQQY